MTLTFSVGLAGIKLNNYTENVCVTSTMGKKTVREFHSFE